MQVQPQAQTLTKITLQSSGDGEDFGAGGGAIGVLASTCTCLWGSNLCIRGIPQIPIAMAMARWNSVWGLPNHAQPGPYLPEGSYPAAPFVDYPATPAYASTPWPQHHHPVCVFHLETSFAYSLL